MLINEIINNSEMELKAMFIIRVYNNETGETTIVYRSWMDNNVPFDICMKPCTMISLCKVHEVGEIYSDCIVLEYCI